MPHTNVESTVGEEVLFDAGFEIVNLTATLELAIEIDLGWLSSVLPDTEYDPEQSPFAVYRPQKTNVTVVIPSNGIVCIVGGIRKHQLVETAKVFIRNLVNRNVPIESSPRDLTLQNVVISIDLGKEIDLEKAAVELGLEQTEYEPEQFSGIIYRIGNGTTGLIFRTGKCTVTGAKTYSGALNGGRIVCEEIDNMILSGNI